MSLLDRIFPWLGHARYLETPPTLVDQAVAALRLDALGRLLVTFEGEAAISYTQHAFTGNAATARSSAALWSARALQARFSTRRRLKDCGARSRRHEDGYPKWVLQDV